MPQKYDHLTPEERAAFAERAAARALTPAPRSARRGTIHNTGNGRTRKRSTRYYLAAMEAIREAAEGGQISATDAARYHSMLRSEAEVFVVLQELELRGLSEPRDVTPDPEEGDPRPTLAPHRVKKVTVKRGTGRHGETIDEKTVSIQSSDADDDLETVAEIEALT